MFAVRETLSFVSIVEQKEAGTEVIYSDVVQITKK